MAVHTVKRGDTLGKLAKHFGTTIADIQAANQIRNVDLIRVGQKLQIPGLRPPAVQPAPVVGEFEAIYVVRKGDTLGKIAKAQGVSLGDLLAHNSGITDPNLVRIGQLINVPVGLKAAAGTISSVIQPSLHGDPPWLAFARKELESDVAEIKGARHNPKILEYHATTTLQAHRDETAWCSSFVNWCVTQAGLRGTNKATARSWLDWGKPLTQPKKGAIAVFWRGRRNDGVFGHVGFFVEDNGSTIKLLGGNQGDRVSVKDQTMGKFLGFRFPE